MKLHLSNLLFLLSAASKSSLFADAQVATVCESLQPYNYNSGDTRAATTVVSVDQAPWIQLDLSDSELAAGAKLTIVGDSATQVITASDLSSANGFSAVFDGSSVSVELSTPGGVRGIGNTSRVVVSNVNVGLCKDDLISHSICGDTDDRIPSQDVRMGRTTVGCTAWLISEDAYITAGHCGTPTSSSRIHFVFGTGSAAPEDQYAVDISSYQGVDGGYGNDWQAGRLLPNSVTGKLPGVAQSEKCGSSGCGWFTLGSVPSSTSGNNIRITGYGTADVASQSQKTHVGALTTIASTYLQYVPDTTPGNSGSPVIHEETGNAIGVHTHGGCSATGGSNRGTRIDVAEFKAHVDYLLTPCSNNQDCDDGLWCNGAEVCNAGKCMSGAPPNCDDGLACTINICNEATDMCESQPKCGSDVCIEPTGECECSGSDKKIEVDILTDDYPAETTWTVTDKCGSSGVVLSGGSYSVQNSPFSESVCALPGQYEFKINDTYGDGICCGYGSGSYSVKYGGAVVASGGAFLSSETKLFGSSSCPGGPTAPPTPNPTTPPTPNPTALPTPVPTALPTALPTPVPTVPPTAPPTAPPTPAPTAPVTQAPTSGDGAVAQEAVFDSVYGVPRCANVGSSCDSLGLLNGRGTITNGTEPNLSNTNKNGLVCNDGNSGAYHSDESIDQITVTAGDLDAEGNPLPSGDFIVEGGRAFVTVKVWCWGTGASDTADIFLTSEASSPDWQPLASITCPGGGEQTIKHAFDVPSGTNQSIRVNFRYSGSPSTCSNGSYDDHDDLIFTVKANPNDGTPPPTPSPTPTPTGGPSGPQTAAYDSGLGAPKCSHGSSCDSVGLLNGRGAIENGNEPNQPNTLNACTDGNSGSYHSDESIDNIVVTRADGGDGDLTEGDEVTITATVWCWSAGTNDYIDFYYASNANSPVWNQIGARQTCPGGQAQTVSSNFVLPSGGLQAVRVNLMYGSGTPGTNKCTTGGFDDTDDLVISVKPNAEAASMAASSTKHDDVQGLIVDAVKNVEADEMEKKLQEMNQSTEKPSEDDGKNGKGKDKKKGEDDGGDKYICAKHEPLAATICAEGEVADDTCSSQGQRCGKGKKCWFMSGCPAGDDREEASE